ncbi:MAG TPA: penicillin acylase family protein [Candidatus Limnocylindrales bacterium]|nr:penicillin acylase family protein [Candidatus Limnocylindrales bacterium]
MNRPIPAIALAAVLAPILVTSAVAQVSGSYRGFGDAGGFLNILPPGQDGVLNGPEAIAAQGGSLPPHVLDQLSMYGDLVYNSPGLTEDRIFEFFKDASFGVREDDIGRTYSPTPGVTVIRDATFGVPHIYGETREATMFAQGYTTAEDRLFLMDILRHVGRARMAEFLGPSPANLHMDMEQLAIAPYKEEDLTEQLLAIRNGSPLGPAMEQDLLNYIAGINAYIGEARVDASKRPAEYEALQIALEDFVPEDVVAIAALVGGVFGKGGGGELRNHCGLKRMAAELGSASEARAIFDDLHFIDDPEAPTTSRTPTPYMHDLGPVDADAHPDVDCDSLVPIDPEAPPVEEQLEDLEDGLDGLGLGAGGMSNAMLISGAHTRNGRPIAVFGPQTGYFIPQLLVEKDVHGPGISARGVSFAGTDLFVQLGRGRDYAWSATSAGGDNVDQFVLRLCEPGGGTATTSSMGYLRNGVCEPIETYQHVQVTKPTAGGMPEGPTQLVFSWRVERTEHYGPLMARGTLEDGTPIAIATLRSTYRNELGSAVGFRNINDPDYMAGGFEAFRQAMGDDVDYTFNWFYIDATNIGYQHSCLCPKRAQGVDPYLPAWGDGRFDWTGFLTLAEQPMALNPPEGYLTSWNNKQAPGFRVNDRNFSYGPTYRSRMFDVRIEPLVAAGNTDRTDMVDAMEDAGTCDLRGQDVLPIVLQVLGETAPVGADPRAQDMRDRLEAWVESGANRRDFDASGEYDDPQSPAIIDAWWPLLTRAVLDESSGHAIDHLGIGFDDGNRRGHVGSAFQDGTYGHVLKDLRQVLGMPVAGSFSRTYCGGGNLDACRAALWDSLSDAAAALEAEFGSPTVADWKRAIADEDVRHSAAGVTTAPAIHWINRPTFQQVVQIGDVDSFACYDSRTARGTEPLQGVSVQVDGEADSAELVVQKAQSVCNVADQDGRGIRRQGAHLACYQARRSRESDPLQAQTASLQSEFANGTVTLAAGTGLCVPASVDGQAYDGDLNRLQCFRAALEGELDRATVSLEDGLGARDARIARLDSVCVPTATAAGPIADAAAALACFRTRKVPGAAPFQPADVDVDSELGSEQQTLRKADRLCVPARVTLD